MELHPDFRELLEQFNADRVEYVVVGGYALAAHGGDAVSSVIGREALIRNKRATGRPQDAVDADRLENPA